MYQRIFVPLDGSIRSEEALPIAARIALAENGSLILGRVISPAIDFSGGLAPVPSMSEDVLTFEMSAANTYLKTLAASPELLTVQARTEVLSGVPAFSLVSSIEAAQANLIVMCSHGRTGFSRLALGSIAHALVHQCNVPVLILRKHRPLAQMECSGPVRVLVPLDGSRLAEAVLEPAAHLVASLAAPGMGSLHLTQVIHCPEDSRRLSQKDRDHLQTAETYLAKITQGMQPLAQELKLTITISIEHASDVAMTLVSLAQQEHKYAQENDTDRCNLIAMSTHGRGALERLVLGSVTERVIANAALPMLIVRPPEQE